MLSSPSRGLSPVLPKRSEKVLQACVMGCGLLVAGKGGMGCRRQPGAGNLAYFDDLVGPFPAWCGERYFISHTLPHERAAQR
jgi:hypothetical protein